MKVVELKDFIIGGDKLTIMAGPCVIENEDIIFKTCEFLKTLCNKLDVNFIFKSSYDKANRSSINSFRGPGIHKGLDILSKIKNEFNVPIVTDIHIPDEANMAKEVVDVLQIPAFLSRQTDLLVAAAKTGCVVNIKKGQFLSPYQMKETAKKVSDSGNDRILITDRGTSFGYNNLVVDFRSVPIIQDDLGYPLIFDATHSVQLPGANGTNSGGERRFVPTLAKAAIASGAKGLFFEVHPNPNCALCDGANMIDFDTAQLLFKKVNDIFKLVNNL